jgi:calcineurin-like phosphoesterase family protein
LGKRWFVSDIHFGHAKILTYQKLHRGHFSSVSEMDDFIISQLNKFVDKRDTVYVIGDFSFYRDIEKNKEILNKLTGKYVLIRGNHDQLSTKEYFDIGFSDVRDELVVKLSNGESVLLKHYPYAESNISIMYKKLLGRLGRWKNYYMLYPIDKGFWHIHGHLHGGVKIKDKQINVSVETLKFKPISEPDICKIINDHKLNQRNKLVVKVKKLIKTITLKYFSKPKPQIEVVEIRKAA